VANAGLRRVRATHNADFEKALSGLCSVPPAESIGELSEIPGQAALDPVW